MSTKQHITGEAGVSTLEALARSWLDEGDEEWRAARMRELLAVAHPSLGEQQVWQAFQDLAEFTRIRDGLEEGTVHWERVFPELTSSTPSADAYEMACDLVDDELHFLLRGRRR